MAEGIDSAAHQGALDGGGKTVAIWGTSLDIVYPRSNRSLAELIKENGAVYSEYLPGTEPDRAYFPERNRIIAGMSDAVVVIEAGEKSGALITAGYATEYGRELFAVPGRPDARKSIGANELIKSGAKLLTSVDDIFRELPRLKGKVAARKFKALEDMTDLERSLVDQLSEGPLQIDNLARGAGIPVSDVMQLLLALELKGVIQEISGKRYILAD
jgi:DNA processing protein